MRITFLVPRFDLTGGARVVAIYATKLKQRGHEVVCVAPKRRRASIRAKIRSFMAGKGQPRVGVGPSHFDGADLDCRLLKHSPPIVDADLPDADVVVATWWETAEWVNALSPAKGCKVYFIQHHEVFSYLPVERSRATYRLPMHKIVISRWLKDLMGLQYEDPSADLILNSVDTAQFFAPPRSKQSVPTVGFLYSLSGFKSIDVVLKSIEIIRSRLGKIRIVAFGSELVSPNRPLPPGTEFHYRPPQDRIRDIYGSCDVWICGSSSEGFHLPPLEAMACRCPVVSTKVGGSIDVIVNGKNGYLVEIGDSFALATKSMSVLGLDLAAWEAMSEAALATATRYSWDDATDLLEEVLERQLGANQQSPASIMDKYGYGSMEAKS